MSSDKKWVMTQKKAFTNWCNDRLKGSDRIEDLYTDFEDGVKLIKLLEILSKKSIGYKYHKKPTKSIHKSENLDFAFKFMVKTEHIHMENLGPEDVEKRIDKQILGLIWHLILKYQFYGNQPTEPAQGGKKNKKPPKPLSPKIPLLNWLKAAMPNDIPVHNLKSDWNDGEHLATLVDTMKPGCIPKNDPTWPDEPVAMTQQTMDIAEKELGIPHIIAAEDLCVDSPDELSVMTYLSYYCSGDNSPGYNRLLEWVRSKIPEYNITNFTDDWRDGRALSALVNAIDEDSIPEHASLNPAHGVENVSKAMSIADSQLTGIQRNITPEAFSSPSTDALLMMGYLEWFRKAVPKRTLQAGGPGIADGPVGEETYFNVKGPLEEGKLGVSIIDPEGKSVAFEEIDTDEEDCHTFMFTPTKPGQHIINIEKDGQPIKKSPFKPNFYEKTLPNLCHAHGPGLEKAIVNRPAMFEVDCSKGGPGDLDVIVANPLGDKIPSNVSWGKEYEVEYTPTRVGPHDIAVLYNSQHISGSPFTSNAINPEKVVVKGDGIYRGTIGIPAEFNVNTEEAGPGKIVVKVQGPFQEVPCSVTPTEIDEYDCSYTPTEIGNHRVEVLFSGELAGKSPYQVEVKQPPDASKIIVDGPHYPEMANGPVTLRCDTSNAGDSELLADCHSDKYGYVMVDVEEGWGGKHDVSFDPPGRDLYKLSVYWDGDHVPGSPFDIDLDPADANRVKVDGPHKNPEGLGPVRTVIDCRDAGDGSLEVTAAGEKTGPVDLDIREKEPRVYEAVFNATYPDLYNVDVKFEGRDVPGSPFQVQVDLGEEMVQMEELDDVESSYMPQDEWFKDGPPSPEPTYEEGIAERFIGHPLTFEVDKELEEGSVSLRASCVGEHAGEIPVETVTSPDGSSYLKIDPRVPDLYEVQVMAGGEMVAEFPMKVRFIAPPPNPSKVKIYDLPTSEEKLVAGDPISYGVDAKQAGWGDIYVKSIGPSGHSQNSLLKVNYKSDKDYKIDYTPGAAGIHKLHIFWNKVEVPNSPVLLEIVPKDVPLYQYGSPVVMEMRLPNVKPKEVSGHAIFQSNKKKCKLNIEKVKDDGDALKFSFKHLDNQPGIYEVHVFNHKVTIKGSPFEVRVLEPPQANNVVVQGLQGVQCMVEDALEFLVDGTKAGSGEFLVRAEEPNGDFSQLKVIDMKDNTFKGVYIPRGPGDHLIHMKWADVAIPGSPFLIKAGPAKDTFTVKDVVLLEAGSPLDIQVFNRHGDQVEGTAEGAETGQADVSVHENPDGTHTATFQADRSDTYTVSVKVNRSDIDGSPMKVMVLDKPTVFSDAVSIPKLDVGMPVNYVMATKTDDPDPSIRIYSQHGQIPVNVVRLGGGKFVLNFKPVEVGEHFIQIASGHQPIEDSPFKFVAEVILPVASKCFVLPEDLGRMSQPLTGSQPCTFRVSTINAGSGALNVTARGPGEAEKMIITEDENGVNTVLFQPTEDGKYVLDVFWDEEPIEDSPFVVVFEGSNRTQVLTGLDFSNVQFRVGKPVKFKTHTDEIGDGKLRVKCQPKSGACISVKELKHNSQQITILPKTPGTHKIFVTHGNQHILGSPFEVVFKECGDATKCHLIEEEEEEELGEQDKITFLVSTEGAGPGTLAASIKNNITTVQADVKPVKQDVYSVSIDAGLTGLYMMHIKYDDVHIQGSPFELVFDNGIPDAMQCRAEGEGLISALENHQATFLVHTDGSDAELIVKIRGEFEKIDPVIFRPENSQHGTYEIGYTPMFSGDYIIEIYWEDAPIPGSPFTVTSYKASDPSQVILDRTSVKDTIMGRAFSFPVDTKGAGKGNLTVLAYGPTQVTKGEALSKGNGLFAVTFNPPEPGSYMVHIHWNGQNIPGSPFKMNVSAPPLPEKVRVTGPGLEDGPAGDRGHLIIDTKQAGAGTLAVRAHGPRGAFKVQMERDPQISRRVHTHYNPTHPGCYTIGVTWSNIHVPGSPFRINIS